jgi:hypothetical protein
MGLKLKPYDSEPTKHTQPRRAHLSLALPRQRNQRRLTLEMLSARVGL